MSLIRLIVLIAFGLTAGTASAQWRRAESPNFVVFSEGPENRLRERAKELEDFHWLLKTMTAATNRPASPNKLHVYVVDGKAELKTVRDMGRDVGGFYASSGEGIAAFVDKQGTGRNNIILFHEYAHHFMHQYFPTAYPAWYIEGFAEYYGTAKFAGRRVDIGNFDLSRLYAVTQQPWLPLERVLRAGPEGLDGPQGAAYYGQSWLIAHYFYSNPERQAALRRYLNAVRTSDPIAALQTATGMNLEQFTRELRTYIGRGSLMYRRMERAEPVPPPVTVTVLPATADDLILHQAALRIGLWRDDPAARLQRIRTAAARHPNDPYARRVLAHAEALHGDRAAALKLLEPLQEQSPNDAELMYLRGRLHLENAEQGDEWDTEAALARTWFGRAHKLDPNHFQTLYRYAQSQRKGRESISENTVNTLLLAQQLAPQVTEIRMNAAGLLIARGDLDLAADLLAPVIADPHDQALAAAARKMLESARSRGRPAPAAPAPAARAD
jgi:Flp pilus assembly protein TadD